MGIALGACAIYAWRRGFLRVSIAAAGVGVALALLSFIAPAVVRPLADAWAMLGRAIGRVTTPILLVIVFVLVVVPLGLLLRIFGSDPLKLKRDPKAASYWVERKKRTFDPSDFERLS